MFFFFFFFSSRRRHTRLQGDWSSDVCSSDLGFLIIWHSPRSYRPSCAAARPCNGYPCSCRSEEYTSEIQSPCNLVCRLLLEKTKMLVIAIPLQTVRHGGRRAACGRPS